MGYPTSRPLIFNAKPALGEASREGYSYPDANAIRTMLVDLAAKIPCTQSVKVSSKGTIRFAPTYAATPKACLVEPKNATGARMMSFSTFRIVTLSSNRIAYSGGTTNTKAGSALATVFY